ncbi:MAG TPA: tetratricopeptide repeat protein [Syntrophales bacterium]|nr:tetratricopeptide repeat protein [Syntrophales bacterium]HQN76998.1 tetratricopeptide repeat protein [Syntrophales bacterium]HQQ26391.1 tetratricopeptide repeat protein [Syntrophales bacterium]
MAESRRSPWNAILRIGAAAALMVFLSCTMKPIHKVTPEQEARNHLDMGIAFLKSKAYTQALEEFLEADRQNPKNPEVPYYLGIAYYGKGLRPEATVSFRRAVRLNPDYSEAWNYLGTLLLESGDYDGAVDAYSRALKNVLFKNPGTSLYNLGIAYFRKGDYGRSVQAFEESLRRDPNTVLAPLIHKNMGISFLKWGNYGKAIDSLRKSAELSPYIAETHYWLGLACIEAGRQGEGMEELGIAESYGKDTEYGLLAKKKLAEISPGR